MIPILFEKGETSFASNGIGRLAEALSCEVTQSRNDQFELVLTYPMTGRHYADIIKGIEDNTGEYGRVIYVTHDASGKPQPFDLYKHTAPMNGVVTFYAHHISYRLTKQVLMPFSAFSAQQAFSRIAQNVVGGTDFTFESDKTTLANFALKVPRTVRQQLGGIEGSMLDVFNGGDYVFDLFNVKLCNHAGVDTGVQIRYGKNLTDLTHDYDVNNCYNAVVPYWTDSETGTTVSIPGSVVSMAEELGQEMRAVPLDLSSDFDSEPTTQQMTAAALAYLRNNQPWIPNENFKISFEQYVGADYENVAQLQKINLLDTVDVIYPKLGINAVKKRVVKTVYNSLQEKYKSMELGEPAKTFSAALADAVEGKVLQVVPSRRDVQAQLDNATAQITGAKDSHIRFLYDGDGGLQEIVILDTEDIETARKVWRFNSGGLGHSSTGYNGTYTIAMTQDGEFVADVIKTGLLSDKQGKSYWNLLTGAMSINGTLSSKYSLGGYIYEVLIENGAITLKDTYANTGRAFTVAEINWGWGTGSSMQGYEQLNIKAYGTGAEISGNGATVWIGHDINLSANGSININSPITVQDSGGTNQDAITKTIEWLDDDGLHTHRLEVTNGIITNLL